MSRFALTAAALMLVCACGLRTAPRPPEDTAPVMEGQVTAQASDGKVELTWKRADRSADGRRLEDLAAFVVERAEQPGEFAPVARVDVVDQERFRRRTRFRHVDDPPAGAATVWYRVRAVTADGQEGPPSAPAAISPPAAN
ncbi:MAG TPA: hypothetical protein VEC57_07095 [Candidatus Limnocylindrales bacterium]|nr:hypothetical protein [Candidatus Limnocylindrales bacterium]